MSNPHKLLAQHSKADKLVATFNQYKISPAKVGLMTDTEWGEVAKFVGVNPPSKNTRDLVIHKLRGGK